MVGIIYKITNKINNKVYIGQTIRSLKTRWKHHIYDALNQKTNTRLARAIRKYGINNFSIEILEQTNQLNEREIYYVDLFKSTGSSGYNIKIGGCGGPHSKETKTKISKANKRRVWTKEMRDRMSDSIKKWHKNNHPLKHSTEAKHKISLANTGRKMPEKAKLKIDEWNKKQSKPVVCLTNGREYPSVVAACKELNLNDGHLRMHLKGRYAHVKGFRFKFTDEDPPR